MRNAYLLFGAAVLALSVPACNENKANYNETAEINKTGTLQGTVFNAVTGERIGGTDLALSVILGTQQRSPAKLVTDTANTFVGDYAFNGLPVTFTSTSPNSKFRVVAIKAGFQRFEAQTALIGSDQTPWVYEKTYNLIGDIYLFPIGTNAGDVVLTVVDPSGTPIPGAVVYLDQIVENNSNTAATTGNRLSDTTGMLPSMTATTGSDGKATFAGTSLTLGGAYTAVVPGLVFGGTQLATNTYSFNVGEDLQTKTLMLNAAFAALYVRSASNDQPGTITADGSLALTFNRPVILQDATKFTATLSNVTANADATKNAYDPNTVVTATLSADSLTLTLKPAFFNSSTPPAAVTPEGKGLTITYHYFGYYVIDQTSQQAYDLFSENFSSPPDLKNILTGSSVESSVQMKSY